MTEKLYEELDEAKAEIEKLRSEYHVKTDLCDNLKKLNNDQLKKIQELNLKLEKQAQEVEAKADEVCAAKQSLEDLACKLKEKENVIKSSSSAIDKLRADFNSKLRESEEEKRELVSSLEEANTKISDLEHQNRAFMDKIEVLKEGILSVSQKKCASESKMAKASKQMRERGDMFEKLEDEKVKLEEQLKWKNEQFKHLEEAHEKLKRNLHTKEKEWGMEKCSLFDNISALETRLDSQITISEVHKRRLETCNKALANEENQRKCLDIQLSESNSCFLETKSKLERLTNEKESVCKEMESKIENLEEENRKLVFSLKELKESQIREAEHFSSIVELQKELKTLDQNHKVSEAEWSSRFEKMVAEMNSCNLELENNEIRLKEITTELDNHNSLVLQLTLENVALKSKLLEARSKINEEKFSLQKEIESHEEQLMQTKTEIMTIRELLDKANEEMAECYCDINEVEFELQIWKSVAEKLKVNLELNHRMRREVEASLLAQVAIEVNLKENLQEKERKINDLEEEIKELKQNTRLRLAKENGEFEKDIEMWEQEWVTKELEAAILAQLESERIHENEKQSLHKLVEEKDERINNLQQIMCSLEEEFDHSTASFSSQLEKMQGEMNIFHEAWEKIRTTVFLKEIEVQEKDLMIIELKNDLEKRVEFVKKCLLSIKKLSSENEKLMDIIGGASEWIHKLSREDGQVMGSLRSIMLSFDENRAVAKGRLELKDHFDPLKENINVHQSSPKRNMVVENSVDERSPLRALNG